MWTSKQDLSCCGCLQLEWWIWSKQPGHALCRTCGLGTRLTKTFEANTGTLKQPSLVNSLTCHHYLTGGSHQWLNVTKKSKNIAVKNYSIFLYVVWPGYAGFMGHFWPMGERLRPLTDSKQDKTEIVLTTVPLWFYFMILTWTFVRSGAGVSQKGGDGGGGGGGRSCVCWWFSCRENTPGESPHLWHHSDIFVIKSTSYHVVCLI